MRPSGETLHIWNITWTSRGCQARGGVTVSARSWLRQRPRLREQQCWRREKAFRVSAAGSSSRQDNEPFLANHIRNRGILWRNKLWWECYARARDEAGVCGCAGVLVKDAERESQRVFICFARSGMNCSGARWFINPARKIFRGQIKKPFPMLDRSNQWQAAVIALDVERNASPAVHQLQTRIFRLRPAALEKAATGFVSSLSAPVGDCTSLVKTARAPTTIVRGE
ncbi:hypothetical protein SJAG_01552 [Schizosaccharomyces japonicus yFS275]|uniref:Uncharacterized protein n=1 Tax=Schizosaccharomyces japonicus (strain yFS275 / FY16936) TaxID=402676 RepID=B6JY92_SCHJY|nr:hypothetical protein SJAG_01552 [Schizosaccharomyces japonicus yFS275]EEB06510.2 hypothetical protein SJAG_01552 [Schizosaccharomyces japonicus yFS275]